MSKHDDKMKDWRIPKVSEAETAALKALSTGTATDYQQKLALACIVQRICMTHDETFHIDNERLSSWYQGRRSVGNFILKEINIDLKKRGNVNV